MSSTPSAFNAATDRKPIGPPPQKEGFGDAQKRIQSVVATGDCDKINALVLVTPPGADKERLQKRCKALKRRLGAGKPIKAQSFAGLAGVLDYQTRTRNFSAFLLRGADGLYHFAYFDRFHDAPTVGTPFAPKFKDVAQAAFDSLRTKNCDAYLKVAYAASGPSSQGKKKVCPRVKKNVVAKFLEKGPPAVPKLIGGNRFFAFYGIDTSNYLTMVLARESPSQRPSSLPKDAMVLPKGAPEYAFVRVYRTNAHRPPS